MARRVRTAKKLAQRIDLGYFKRSHPLRRSRALLCWAVPVLALAWLGWHSAAGDALLYSHGPVSAAHTAFAGRCSVCHVDRGGFFLPASDEACRGCHDGPLHQARQLREPACGDCHREHRAAARLAQVSDGACTSCHAQLETREGAPRFATAIRAFGADHPEFAALRSGASDLATLKLNHAVHLRPDLQGPDGRVQLGCTDCHRPDEPIRHERDCARCHRLLFDEQSDAVVPHDRPEVVHAFLLHHFDGAEDGVAAAERLLWRKTCRECHSLREAAEGGLPEIVPPAVPTRWLPHAEFEHRAHRMLRCSGCHDAAATSERTTDVLLPGIDSCRSCHRPGAADSRCSGCHRYHDRRRERPVEGRFSIEELAALRRGGPDRYSMAWSPSPSP